MSKYIYGMHDYSQEYNEMIINAGVEGWTVYAEGIGHDSNDNSGKDFYHTNLTPIVRLSNAFGSGGGIPAPKDYDNFAQRCANYITNSNGIKRVIIHNEPNIKDWDYPEESGFITLEQYVECYQKCYNRIKSVNANIMVAPAPLATWAINPEAGWNDWISDMVKMFDMIGHDKIDWIALHAYSTSPDLNNFTELKPMDSPFEHRTYSFAVLWEYMQNIPKDMRYKEVHITETNMNTSWDKNGGQWVQTLYKTINDWNQNPDNQKILSASLFRWNHNDERWDLSKSETTKQDFYQALKTGYQHNYELKAPELEIKPKLPRAKRPYVNAELGLNLRASPNGKILSVLPHKTNLIIRLKRDGWFNVKVNNDSGLQGWVWGEYVLE